MLNLKNPDLYNNRELSWLQFNTRVLKQAQDESLPLLERLKFLAIYGTNLDEFYMIRVAGLKKLFAAVIIVSGADRLTPLQQLKEISLHLKEGHIGMEVKSHPSIDLLKHAISGTSILISLSNLPGLRNAGSSVSGMFVAPMTITFPLPFNPSMSVRS